MIPAERVQRSAEAETVARTLGMLVCLDLARKRGEREVTPRLIGHESRGEVRYLVQCIAGTAGRGCACRRRIACSAGSKKIALRILDGEADPRRPSQSRQWLCIAKLRLTH